MEVWVDKVVQGQKEKMEETVPTNLARVEEAEGMEEMVAREEEVEMAGPLSFTLTTLLLPILT